MKTQKAGDINLAEAQKVNKSTNGHTLNKASKKCLPNCFKQLSKASLELKVYAAIRVLHIIFRKIMELNC